MLSELHIENLAVITEAGIKLHPGLNVITGETGAGKTILAHAISLLLGVRADSGLIRPGVVEASVEAVFTVPQNQFADISEDIDLPDGDELIVRRRISRDGRSRAFLGGRSTTLGVLAQVTGRLLAFSAQHEQRSLMMASRQLDILDDFAGKVIADLRDEYGFLFDRRARLLELLEGRRNGLEAREREAALLRFQIEEIDGAGLVHGEDNELESGRQRLLRSRELREATGELASAISGDQEGECVMDRLAQLLSRLENSAGIDRELDELMERLQKSFYELEETGRCARDYSDSVQEDPALLKETEERLELIGQLKRKYGKSVEEIIAYAAQAGEELKQLTVAIEDAPLLEGELVEIESEILEIAAQMREIRKEAAIRLETETTRNLEELSFQDCGFEVRLSPVEGESELNAHMLTRSGSESVDFMVRLNPGMPSSPLNQTASGGELSRIMLAIKSAVSSSNESATLVFDEIDAGIGGETGAAVGARLKRLANNSQIICITHLPQIAGFADAQFSVSKSVKDGETITAVTRLESDDVILDELCRMMGSKPEDSKARNHAGSLLERAAKS